jgi:cardiolipin synthase
VAWVVVVIVLPAVGMLAYLLVGETNIGRKRVARARQVSDELPAPASLVPDGAPQPDPGQLGDHAALFRLGESINGFRAVSGNTARLTADSNDAIDCMVADIDAAREHVHLIFYIWLADNNGLRVVDALCRAAGRGVTCRAMADGLGSRAMIKSEHWQKLQNSGVKTGIALPLNNPLLKPFSGRLDLRNHRKIVVIDNRITYCGSQNCADPEFRVKAKYAPWVDVLMRFEGPVVMQNQRVFISDWMTYVNEDIGRLLQAPPAPAQAGFPAQVIATGPTVRASAMPEVFSSLLYAARTSIMITTPYYVPNEAMQAAFCAAANRGVDTTFIVPERNDSFIVAAASHSYYRQLLSAGVKIREFRNGLLHAKTVTVDEDVTLIGSANMDRRSFDLNYENNILLYDRDTTAMVRERQRAYLAQSNPVTLEDIEQWSMGRHLWNNTLAMLGPVL